VAVSIVPKSNFKDSAFVISFAISFASMIQKKKKEKKKKKERKRLHCKMLIANFTDMGPGHQSLVAINSFFIIFLD